MRTKKFIYFILIYIVLELLLPPSAFYHRASIINMYIPLLTYEIYAYTAQSAVCNGNISCTYIRGMVWIHGYSLFDYDIKL